MGIFNKTWEKIRIVHIGDFMFWRKDGEIFRDEIKNISKMISWNPLVKSIDREDISKCSFKTDRKELWVLGSEILSIDRAE